MVRCESTNMRQLISCRKENRRTVAQRQREMGRGGSMRVEVGVQEAPTHHVK